MDKIIEQKELYVIKNLENNYYYEGENIFRSSEFYSTKYIEIAMKFVDNKSDYIKEIINKYPHKKLVIKKIIVTYEEVEE